MSNGEINEATLLAYLNKELSNEEMIKVDLWLAKSSKNMEKFTDIRKVWQQAGELDAKPVVVDTDKAWDNVLGQINTNDNVIPINSKKPKKIIFSLIAASLVLMFGAASVLFFLQTEIPQVQTASDSEIVKDVLPDGSEITLNQNSMISYPGKFDEDERRVQLSGEAFFDVERDEKKPFLIDLYNDFYVKVLGTSFNIDANENDTITEVYVASGKVEFGSEIDKIILTKGEKGIMNNQTGKVRKVEEKDLGFEELFWIDQSLEFDGEPLIEVIGILEKVYHKTISIHCPGRENEPIKSSHSEETLEEVLEVIAEVHRLKVVMFDGTFVLECND